MYYLQNRYYNPEIGRFINADAISGQKGDVLTHNAFAYCVNDPVNKYDPDGRSAILGWLFGQIFKQAFKSAVKYLAKAVASYVSIKIAKATGKAYGQSIPKSQTSAQAYTQSYINSASKAGIAYAAPPKEEQRHFWLAQRQNNDVVRLLPLSEAGAVFAASAGYNIICRDQGKAKGVAIKMGNKNPKLDMDYSKFGTPGYYPHYHKDSDTHGDPHIWFYYSKSLCPI